MPLSNLAPAVAQLGRTRKDAPAFLAPHHIEAAIRFRLLFDRAQLRQRTTMHYGPRSDGGGVNGGMADISDMAADARRQINAIHKQLPRDCAGVLFDACGCEMGLQDIEAARNWPRRSGKLVLRIALEALAQILHLQTVAEGPERSESRAWRGDKAKPAEWG